MEATGREQGEGGWSKETRGKVEGGSGGVGSGCGAREGVKDVGEVKG